MGELTASIAHEINQPLAAVATNAGSCLQWLQASPPNVEQARKAANRIIRDSDRASAVISRIRGLLKQEQREKNELIVNDVIEEVLKLVRNELYANRVKVQTRLSVDLPPVVADRYELQQVFLNLFVNAVESMSEVGGRPRVLSVVSEDAGDSVSVKVRDTGSGLDPRISGNLFDAFVSTKPRGMGLGLAICRSILEAHGGKLAAAQADPIGAVLEVRLPRSGGQT
jgi:C4-dicarboxylate-specific signal transduction histidine kinase